MHKTARRALIARLARRRIDRERYIALVVDGADRAPLLDPDAVRELADHFTRAPTGGWWVARSRGLIGTPERRRR